MIVYQWLRFHLGITASRVAQEATMISPSLGLLPVQTLLITHLGYTCTEHKCFLFLRSRINLSLGRALRPSPRASLTLHLLNSIKLDNTCLSYMYSVEPSRDHQGIQSKRTKLEQFLPSYPSLHHKYSTKYICRPRIIRPSPHATSTMDGNPGP